jgi:histone deacetylase complex regulatory component SIN3
LCAYIKDEIVLSSLIFIFTTIYFQNHLDLVQEFKTFLPSVGHLEVVYEE